MLNSNKNDACQADSETCNIIIEFNEISESQERHIKKYGTIKHFFPMINSYVVELPRSSIEELILMENVMSVSENTHITAQMNNGRRAVNADSAHRNGLSGKSVTIAFLDTGIAPILDFTYPKNRILAFKDFINSYESPYDDNGHGTHVWSSYSYHWKREVWIRIWL